MTDAAATGVIEDAVAIVPVRDIAATMDFYADTLGFERRMVMPDFAIAVHGEAALHFLATDNAGALTATANHISVYLWVSGIDALWERLRGGLEALPEGRVRAPFDQPYGMREFHVKDPDGCLLMFGEARSDG
jgi:catechol 2,3-dioxygenase-like lactoylglutathione lyase family enzyme